MKNYDELTDNDGEVIVKAVRKIVTEYLNNKLPEFNEEFKKRFSHNAGVFVTLTDTVGLRGCIGYPLPDRELHMALKDASVASATKDPRFPSLNKDELSQVNFEVTILSEPEIVLVIDPKEYPSKIIIGLDGLIVEQAGYSGLLLPQVPVQYGWNEKEFLEHACEKAGLEKDCWQCRDVMIKKFQGVVFAEEKPNGKIVRKSLA